MRKARKFFKENSIETEFIDFKKTSVECERVHNWVESAGIDVLFNSRGTTYRTLKLKELNLDAQAKEKYLCDENMLLKRPIVEFKEQVVVGFDIEKYKQLFIN